MAHYTFLPRCNALGQRVARPVCADPAGVDRDAVHEQVSAQALAFFGRTLKAQAPVAGKVAP